MRNWEKSVVMVNIQILYSFTISTSFLQALFQGRSVLINCYALAGTAISIYEDKYWACKTGIIKIDIITFILYSPLYFTAAERVNFAKDKNMLLKEFFFCKQFLFETSGQIHPVHWFLVFPAVHKLKIEWNAFWYYIFQL